jgi:hypothetical protein
MLFDKIMVAFTFFDSSKGRSGIRRIKRNQRHCINCDKHDIWDEYHFTLICSCYIDLRKLYIQKYHYAKPSMFKFLELLQNDKRTNSLKLNYV